MKYLAILKDSFREAIDTKVFYVMLALSGLAILLVGSISYRAVEVEEDVKSVTDLYTALLAFRAPAGQAPRMSYSDFKKLSDHPEPWKADYNFTITLHFPEGFGADPQAQRLRDFIAPQLKRDLEQHFTYLDHLKINREKGPDGNEIRFAVTSSGTKIDNFRGWKHEPTLFYGALPLSLLRLPLGAQIYFIEDVLVNGIGAWITILISIVLTAFFIPNMLRKGTVDLLLVKPMNRITLLMFKFIGGLTFILLNTAFVVAGIWLVLGLRSGIWATGFLCSIFVLTFFFAILYCVSTLFGVVTRSPIVAILVTCFAWGILFGVGALYGTLDQIRHPAKPMAGTGTGLGQRPGELKEEEEPKLPEDLRNPIPAWVYATVDTIHYILPRTRDLTLLNSRLIIKDVLLDDNPRLTELDKTPFSWTESLTVSGIFIAVMLSLACWWFANKDY